MDSTAMNTPRTRFTYCIERPNGSFVPLIPADEIPVRLVGVPRSLTQDQSYGLVNLGLAPFTGRAYNLDNESIAGPNQIGSWNSPWRQENVQQAGAVSPNQAAMTHATVPSFGRFYRPATPPSGIRPDQSRKEYCTYWLEHGRCKYTQQGCKYKHVMPNLELLHYLGFDGYPKWWQESKGLDKWGNQRIDKRQWRPSDLAAAENQSMTIQPSSPMADDIGTSAVFAGTEESSLVRPLSSMGDDNATPLVDLTGFASQSPPTYQHKRFEEFEPATGSRQVAADSRPSPANAVNRAPLDLLGAELAKERD